MELFPQFARNGRDLFIGPKAGGHMGYTSNSIKTQRSGLAEAGKRLEQEESAVVQNPSYRNSDRGGADALQIKQKPWCPPGIFVVWARRNTFMIQHQRVICLALISRNA